MKTSPQRRRAIVDAAARSIAQRGFHATSMRTLARETGQALATFYNYFPSKNDLLLFLQTSAFEAMIASAEAALAGRDSPSERLLAFIDQHVSFLSAHPEVMRVLVHEAGALPPAGRRGVRRLKERYYDLARSVVADLCGEADPGELERITYGLFGMLNWTYGWYRPARHGPPAAVARSLQRLALSGLRRAAS
jgi:AcrR family transcriptional regulator